MRKHLQRESYFAAPATRQRHAQHLESEDSGNHQKAGFRNDPYDAYSLPHTATNPNPITTWQHNHFDSWPYAQEKINAAKSQDQALYADQNRESNFSTVADAPERFARHKHHQKLHRSCNDLNLNDLNECGNALPSTSSEFHTINSWRDIRDNSNEVRPNVENQYATEHVDRLQNIDAAHCDIANCGKILWISRNPNTYLEAPSKIGRPQLWHEATAPQAPAFTVRTSAQGLPYTPSPHQRRAYLANQHAIEAAIPLVVNGGGSYNRRKKSPNRYFESDVNIHYKTPVRYEYKDPIAEEELAMRQAEQMQKLYQEERRRKYLQELQDMNSRRHADNFTPSQKSPIPLNRYEDFQADLAPKTPSPAMSPRTVARALYNFQGQTARELSFRKGDVIYIRRKIDKNWYEGEHNAMIGLLPASYVELITKDGVRQPPRRTSEGQARAKYNFQAQSGIELSLNKGELVTLTRRVDDNWFEGKIANRKGIFPVSYVEILSDIGSKDYSTPRAVMNQRPSLETLRANVNDELNAITQNGHHTPNGILRDTRNTPTTDMLHVDTSTNPLSFRALYKYRPQNSDELELQEGDIVHVLEKCDDGWFVGTSQRTGYFGTFPGNYVERV